MCNERKVNEKTIALHTDRLAALNPLSSIQVHSKLEWDCPEALKKLDREK